MTAQLSLGGEHDSGAVISDCQRYRYELWRRWAQGPDATFCMLNPSTADYRTDDPTIRKCIGFAKRWNCGGVRVVNIFARRSTDPRELLQHSGDVLAGPDNNKAIRHAFELAATRASGPVVVAWGAFKHPAIEERARDVAEMAAMAEIELKCLGRSADGSPRHPLMLPYNSQLEVWP